MYTCIHVYMYTCIHVYIYTYIHIYISTYIHIYIYTYIHIYIVYIAYIYISWNVQTHGKWNGRTCIYIYLCIYIYVYIYIHMSLNIQISRDNMHKTHINIHLKTYFSIYASITHIQRMNARSTITMCLIEHEREALLRSFKASWHENFVDCTILPSWPRRFEVQTRVIPKFGFARDLGGVLEMVAATSGTSLRGSKGMFFISSFTL